MGGLGSSRGGAGVPTGKPAERGWRRPRFKLPDNHLLVANSAGSTLSIQGPLSPVVADWIEQGLLIGGGIKDTDLGNYGYFRLLDESCRLVLRSINSSYLVILESPVTEQVLRIAIDRRAIPFVISQEISEGSVKYEIGLGGKDERFVVNLDPVSGQAAAEFSFTSTSTSTTTDPGRLGSEATKTIPQGAAPGAPSCARIAELDTIADS